MKDWMKFALFTAVSAGLLVLLVRVNPGLISADRWRDPVQWHPPGSGINRVSQEILPAATGFSERVSEAGYSDGEDRLFFYRFDEARSGVDENSLVPLRLKLDWRFENLNIGTHSVSKASPAVDETGVYVGADTGWFYAFDHAGGLLWKFHSFAPIRGIHSTAVLTKNRVCFGGYGGTFYCLRKSDGAVIWTVHFEGTGMDASALLSGNDLYVTMESFAPQNAYVAKIRFDDGTVLWRSPGLGGGQVRASPALDPRSEALYVGDKNGVMVAIGTRSGEILWQRHIGGDIKSTPLLADGGVFVTTWGKRILKLDPANGNVIWSAGLGAESDSSPTMIPGTGTLVVGTLKGEVLGIDAKKGAILWRRKTDGPVLSSAIAVREAGSRRMLAWIACGEKHVCAFDAKGSELARVELPGKLTGSVTPFGGALYLALDFPGGLVRLH